MSQYEYCTGGKNGYTPSAGRTLVTTAEKNNLRLTVVTLNDGGEYETHKNLYEYSYQNYKRYKILDKKKFVISKSFFKDEVYIKKSFFYPLTEEEKNQIKTVIKIEKKRGYKNGERIGRVDIELHNKKIGEVPIYAKTK